MSGTEDLRNLLDRLKEEVGPLPPETKRELRAPADRETGPGQAAPARYDRFARPHRPEAQREPQQSAAGTNVIWSENKETMLFGVLAALIAVLGGIISGIDYLVLIGAIVFMLFSFVTCLALFGYYLNFRRRAPEDAALTERVDALSRKIEMLSSRAASGAVSSYGRVNPEKERELEHKVEELRVLVRTLAKSVEQQNK